MLRCLYTVCFLILLTNGKAFGNIVLTVSETDVTTELFDYRLIYNGSISVTASGGVAPYFYTLVSPGGVNLQQRNGYFPALDAGVYTLTVIDATGMSTIITVTVSYVYPQPAVTASDLVIPNCTANGGFTLHGDGGTPPYEYSIDGGTTYSVGNIFKNLAQGNYVILIKDANGQIGMIGVNTSSRIAGYLGLFGTLCDVTASAQFSPSACGNDGNLHATVSSGRIKYSFSLDGVHFQALVPDPQFPQLAAYDSSGLAPGLYNFFLGDGRGNESIYAYVIIKFCTLPISFSMQTATCGQSDGAITVDVTGGVPPYVYTMDGIHYQNSAVFSGLPSGNYAVTVKDAGGLSNSMTATLHDDCPMDISSTTVRPVCGNQQGSISISVAGGTPPLSYSIDGINFQNSDSFPGLGPGNYKLTVMDHTGLTATGFATVGNVAGPQLSPIPIAASCSGVDGGIILSGTGGAPPYQYALNGAAWQDSTGFGGLSPGPYMAAVRDANGCTTTGTVTVPLNKMPVKVSAGNDTSVLIGQPVSLHAIDVGKVGFTEFQWSPPQGLNNPTIADPVATLRTGVTYTVRASTPVGCVATASLSIKVFTAYDLYVPNAFTPNGDGHNDLLKVVPVGMKQVDYFAVYNRQGARLFYTTDAAKGWDGTLNGSPQVTDVYVWMAGGVDYKGQRVDRRGTVMLVR